MKQEELFLSVEQCKRLQGLGMDMSDSAYSWVIQKQRGERELAAGCGDVSFVRNLWPSTNICHTYTLDEILRKLPLAIVDEKKMVEYDLYIDFSDGYIGYANCPYDFGQLGLCDYEPHADSLLANAYELLCWCIENKFIRKKK